MGYRQLTNTDRDEIWRLHGKGHNANEISKATGRAYSTVATLLKRTGGVRPVPTRRSERHLSLEEREEISRGLRARATFIDIARQLRRSPSTVSREVGRNGGRYHYRAVRADHAATDRGRRPKVAKLADHDHLRMAVATKLKLHWSPQQISAWLAVEHPDDPTMRVSHETIYVSLYRNNAQLETHAGQCLRTRRMRRRPRRRGRGERRGKNPNMVLISHRPAEADDRRVPGHWEGDLIHGRGHRRAIGTVVERSSRYVFLLDLIDGFPTERVCDLLSEQFAALPPGVVRTLTWDQGTEMSGHQAFTARTGSRCTSATPAAPGSGRRTRTPTGYCVTTSPRASTSQRSPEPTLTEPPTSSTLDPDEHSDGSPRLNAWLSSVHRSLETA